MSRTIEPSLLRGRHVLLWLAGFFGVMFAVNGIFVWLALSTFGGIDTPDAYRKGLAYNATIAAEVEQAALGWSAKLGYSASEGLLSLEVASPAGRPVSGLAISGWLRRPATNRLDQDLPVFREPRAGRYELALGPLAAGAWIADLEARDNLGGTTYRLRERLWLSPKP